MRIWVSEKKKVLSIHTYSWVSVWCGWGLAHGSSPGPAFMFTCSDPGQSMDGKGWSYISASGFALSQEWGRRRMFHRTWPLTEQGLYRTLYNQVLHHNRLRSHCRLSCSGLNWGSWLLFQMTAHDLNPARSWADNSITQGNTESRTHNHLCVNYFHAWYGTDFGYGIMFYVNWLISLNSALFSIGSWM